MKPLQQRIVVASRRKDERMRRQGGSGFAGDQPGASVDDTDEEYDLDKVTAQIAAMKAKRQQRHDSRMARAPVIGRAKDESLLPEGHVANPPVRGCVRDEQLRLVDRAVTSEFELVPADLSSSESELDSDGSQQSDSTNSLPSDESEASRRGGQLGRHRQGRARKLQLKDSLDLTMSLSTSEEPGLQLQPSQLEHAQGASGDIDNSSWVPKLVQRRRQLEKAAVTLPNTATPSKTKDTQARNAPRGRHPSIHELHSHAMGNGAASIGLRPSHQPRPNAGYLRPATGPSAPKSLLVSPPAMNQLSASRKSVAVRSTASTRSPAKGLAVEESELRRHEESTSALLAPPKAPALAAVVRNDPIAQGEPEEAEFTSKEEQELLQSLEKLDRRLTHLTAPPPPIVREGARQDNQRQLQLTKLRHERDTALKQSTDAEIYAESLRVAPYGGGTHCKLRQQSSPSVRSSSAKRAELSGGVHKARVRVGGAVLQDVDAAGKHKVVVKKNLAHLLF